MFGRKTGFLAAMVMALALFGGCGADGKVDERQARNWYNEMTKNGSLANETNPDGYGVYSGGPVTGSTSGDNLNGNNASGERNTYGMRTDNGADNTLGQDIRNAWDNVKNDVKNMGNDNAGGNNKGK